MKVKRTYSAAFKRQVVEELLSGSATMGQLSRRYELSTGLIGYWKSRYMEGKLIEGKSTNVNAIEARCPKAGCIHHSDRGGAICGS